MPNIISDELARHPSCLKSILREIRFLNVSQILRCPYKRIGLGTTLPTVEFAIKFSRLTIIGEAPFALLYRYLPLSFPSIAFYHDNPASMDFINKRWEEDPPIMVGDKFVVSKRIKVITCRRDVKRMSWSLQSSEDRLIDIELQPQEFKTTSYVPCI